MTRTPVRLTDMLLLAEAHKHVGIIVQDSLDSYIVWALGQNKI